MAKKNIGYKRDLELLIIFIAILVGIAGYAAYSLHHTAYHQALIFLF